MGRLWTIRVDLGAWMSLLCWAGVQGPCSGLGGAFRCNRQARVVPGWGRAPYSRLLGGLACPTRLPAMILRRRAAGPAAVVTVVVVAPVVGVEADVVSGRPGCGLRLARRQARAWMPK